MTRYYDLSDDMTTLGRWHLDMVLDSDGQEADVCEGTRFQGRMPLTTHVSHVGRVLEFSLTSFGVPIAT